MPAPTWPLRQLWAQEGVLRFVLAMARNSTAELAKDLFLCVMAREGGGGVAQEKIECALGFSVCLYSVEIDG